MAKIKQFKLARRLGVPLFPKCKSSKFSLAPKTQGKSKHFSQKTDYGLQLLEKQKARYSYMVQERQFARYVKDALMKKGVKTTDELYRLLETRLDNVVYRLGLGPSLLAARQLVSHGHIMVNGRRVTVPSYHVKKGDSVAIRTESQAKPVFSTLSERLKEHRTPSWLTFDEKKRSGTVEGVPTISEAKDAIFDLGPVIEFYSRS